MAFAGSNPCDARAGCSLLPHVLSCSGAKASSNLKVSARSPMPPGKLIRYGVSEAMNTAWLGVPTTCRPGLSCFEKTPLNGSTTEFKLCRSTSPHTSDTGRAANHPICSVSLSNNVLRMTSTVQSQHLMRQAQIADYWCTEAHK